MRLANSFDDFPDLAVQAVVDRHQRGEILSITAQNLIEFRAVATRPIMANGLGLSPTEAEAKAAGFEATFPLLEETSNIYTAWKALVAASGVIGEQVHDARLVAVRHAHGVTHLLTFNVAHFARLATVGPGIIVVDPGSI